MNRENLRHEKKDCQTALFAFPFSFYHFANIQTRKLLTLSRKLPSCFRDNTSSFRVCIRVLPASIDQSFPHLCHLPERASHPTHKAPLALHIGFQIFCTLPISLTSHFGIIKMLHNCTGDAVPAPHPECLSYLIAIIYIIF